ncbi:AroM protein [Salmonella enterica subsp. enterica]|nr:AroM protein [Salmonella enterica subsp. enterica]
MSASLAILTIGVVPMSEVLPLLTEYIDEQHITHHSLLGKMSREDVMADYAVEPGDDPLLTLLNDNQIAHVSRQKVERDLQSVVEVLDNQGYDVIILMSTAAIKSMAARNSILLEPLAYYSTACRLYCGWTSGGRDCACCRTSGGPGEKMAGIANAAGVFAGESGSRF